MCQRCGTKLVGDTQCICTGMTDEQASYIKSLHNQVERLKPPEHPVGFYY